MIEKLQLKEHVPGEISYPPVILHVGNLSGLSELVERKFVLYPIPIDKASPQALLIQTRLTYLFIYFTK